MSPMSSWFVEKTGKFLSPIKCTGSVVRYLEIEIARKGKKARQKANRLRKHIRAGNQDSLKLPGAVRRKSLIKLHRQRRQRSPLRGTKFAKPCGQKELKIFP